MDKNPVTDNKSRPAEQISRLYSKIEPLTFNRHRSVGFSADANYRFSRGAVSVPATLSELVLAQRHYPVVFAGDTIPIPILLLGIRDEDGNLFVDDNGKWLDHAYVPAFLRRYPFIARPKPDKKSLVLGADMASDLLVNGGEHPFFEDEQPTARAQKAFELSVRLHHDFEAAREFGMALAEMGLLKEQQAEVTLPDGVSKLKLTNFKMVDEAELGALADDTILEWRRRGWLPPLHAHLMSLANWTDLARRSHARSAQRDLTSGE